METEKYLTPEEVAVELRVKVETVWRYCRLGLGRRVGGQYRITHQDIDEFFPKDTARGVVEPAQEVA